MNICASKLRSIKSFEPLGEQRSEANCFLESRLTRVAYHKRRGARKSLRISILLCHPVSKMYSVTLKILYCFRIHYLYAYMLCTLLNAFIFS